jgi:hypothetical protein
MKILPVVFQILFYPGSHIPHSSYEPLLSRIRQHHPVEIGSLRSSDANDTILIGHSFGATFALLDAMREPERVRGVVVFQGHFNSRWRAIYPPIRQKKIHVPVLTVLGGRDQRLPIRVALDDVFEKIQYGLHDKYYIIEKDFGHFSGMTAEETNETVVMADHAIRFMDGLEARNMTATVAATDVSRFDPCIPSLIPRSIVLSRSTSLMDALLGIATPEWIWNQFHWWWFLLAKADDHHNYVFETEDSIYIKARGVEAIELERKVRAWTDVTTRIITLPTIHTAILPWLWMPLRVRSSFPILRLPINDNTTYYRIPHPNRVFEIKN